MPAPVRTPVTSVGDYIAKVEDALPAGGVVWYRGVGVATGATPHTLRPGLYRDDARQDHVELLRLERDMVAQFERSVKLLNLPELKRPDLLAQMQHYQVKTRLLDWSTNALMGLYFALTSAKLVPDEGAAVWLLDPNAWTNHSLRGIGHDTGPLTMDNGHSILEGYDPKAGSADDIRVMRDEPAAVILGLSSNRLLAQSGTFTLFGKKVEPMEQLFEISNYPAGALSALTIERDLIAPMRKTVFQLGVNELTAYPDAHGLAQKINREAGF